MKKLSFIISCFLVFLCAKSHAQAQWKFHLAFEDATGAKDTIWCIWDTSATGGILGQYDSHLGEGAYPFDYNVFNVWILNDNFDSTKTFAYPFYYTTLSLEIHAFNHQYPITISWDSSLFHSPNLPQPVGSAWLGNNYFTVINNDPPSQAFNMLWDSSVIVDAANWGWGDIFPMDVLINQGQPVNVIENKFSRCNIVVYPNPASDMIKIKSTYDTKRIVLQDNLGRVVRDILFSRGHTECLIPLEDIINGYYNLIITDHNNQITYEKIIINH